MKLNHKTNKKAGAGLEFGIELFSHVIAGLVLGATLDAMLETKPFLMIICVLASFAAVFKNRIMNIAKK